MTSPLPRLLPWLVPLVVAVAALSSLGVPALDLVRYGSYFAGCVVLPGVLLLRALWRSTGTWAEDVGLGAAVGFAYELIGWALFTALDLQDALVVWPLLLLVVFAAVPRWRRYWRIARPSPLPVLWSWGVALCAAALLAGLILGVMADHPVPPDGANYYPDLLFHLSMVQELVRSVPPELPQVAGEPLAYHWLPNAQMAAGVDISRVDAAQVLFRLWLVPLAVVAVLVFAALGRTVTKVWWTGVLVPVLTLPGMFLLGYTSSGVDIAASLAFTSPSQTFGVVTGTAAAVFLVEAVHRGGGRGIWVLTAALAVVGGGAKPSTLPVLLGGVGLAAVFLLVRDRRIPWRSALAGALLLGTVVLTMLTVSGSTAGSGVQLFAVVRYLPGYQAATGDRSMSGTGGWLLPSLASGDKVAVAGGLVEIAALVLVQLLLLVGFGILLARTSRTNPIAWLLVGALTAGWLGFLLVDHPSGSQGYFLRSAVPFGAAAAAWLVALGVRGRSPRTAAVVGLAGVAVGVLIATVVQLVGQTPTGDRPDQIKTLAEPVLVTLGLLALAAALWWLLVRQQRVLAGLGLVLVVLVPLGIAVAATAETAWRTRNAGSPVADFWQIRPDEAAAALWLGAHAKPEDVVVTNTACRPAGTQVAGCDARGYVVSGIAGRRTLVEGWAYTQQAMSRHGADGKRYTVQPSPWSDRTALTNQVLTAPTPELLDRLYREFGVRWIYADRWNGKVSAQLDQLAVLSHQDGQVRIYQVPSR